MEKMGRVSGAQRNIQKVPILLSAVIIKKDISLLGHSFIRPFQLTNQSFVYIIPCAKNFMEIPELKIQGLFICCAYPKQMYMHLPPPVWKEIIC